MEENPYKDINISEPNDPPPPKKHWWNKPIEFDIALYLWIAALVAGIVMQAVKEFSDFISH